MITSVPFTAVRLADNFWRPRLEINRTVTLPFVLKQCAGTGRTDGAYAQDHLPVIEQREAVGHAVRAAYLYTGMADVAALTDHAGYLTALQAIWQDVVAHKLHLTGGIGARHEGEAFGEAYELPNETAYNETCAAIGNIFWQYRLFLLTGDGRSLHFAPAHTWLGARPAGPQRPVPLCSTSGRSSEDSGQWRRDPG